MGRKKRKQKPVYDSTTHNKPLCWWQKGKLNPALHSQKKSNVVEATVTDEQMMSFLNIVFGAELNHPIRECMGKKRILQDL
jgi:hypothetical protein